MSEEIKQKKKEVKELALNRDLERKALDRSAARDELSEKEEGENNEQDGQ